MDIKFKDFSYDKYGDLKEDNKILYDFFYKRFLCDKKRNPESHRNIHGFDKIIPQKYFDVARVDGSLMNENCSQEGRTFWRAFYENTMTKEQKSKLFNIIKKELLFSKSYNLWI